MLLYAGQRAVGDFGEIVTDILEAHFLEEVVMCFVGELRRLQQPTSPTGQQGQPPSS